MRLLHCGIANLSVVIFCEAFYVGMVKLESKMLKKIYRAMILAKAVSAAMKTLQNSTDAQLADAGIDRTTYALNVMKQIEAEFYKKDAKANATTDAVADANMIHQAI
jgi:hypothetical protein